MRLINTLKKFPKRTEMKLSITSLTSLSLLTTRSSSLSTSSTPTSSICNARKLGSSDLTVSESCLGTMTFGVQNNQNDAFEQINYAISQGCNFIDTAELYPVPLTAPEWKAGVTESIIGEYIKSIGSSERDELVIASKIAGFFPNSPVASERFIPPKKPHDCRLDAKSVKEACDASLRRLNTDRIDLMQLHWPDRYVPAFGLMSYKHEQARDSVSILETATALKELIDEGKIRYIGLSNESTYGVCEWVKACEKLGIKDKLASIQNSYSLLDRRFDSELAEACHHYNIGLLPWSILAGGLLSGKYRKSPKSGIASSPSSRFIKYPEYMRRWSPKTASQATLSATEEYACIAEDIGMTPTQLAIAFVRSRKFINNGSVIVGATTLEQLKENMKPFDDDSFDLDEDVLKRIDEVHLKCRDPCCSL